MNKNELIQQIAEQEGIDESEVRVILEEWLRLIRNRMMQQEETQIYSFGKFGVRWWKGRTGRDPQTGEEIDIEGRWVPYWSPSDTLVEEGEPHPGEKDDSGTEAEDEPQESPQEASEDTPDFEVHVGGVYAPPEDSTDQGEEAGKEDEFGDWPRAVPAEESAGDEAATAEETSEGDSTFDWPPRRKKRNRTRWIFIIAGFVVAILVFGWWYFSSRPPGSITTTESAVQEVESRDYASMTENGETPPSADQTQSPVMPGENGDAVREEEKSTTAESMNRNREEPSTGNQSVQGSAGIVEPYQFSGSGGAGFLETYNDALDAFRAGEYQQAERIFRRLLISDPPRTYADNTQYWIGECLFARRVYPEAIRAFEQVFGYPNTNKVEDSLIMIAYAYLELEEYGKAREFLMKFRTQYPHSRYRDIADRWLKKYGLLTLAG